ncbi:MAG: hypothetical protein Q9218_007484 [Villophora microphyllina]
MEPVSLTVGAVALVSLLTTCVECFAYVDSAKSCGRDLELLTTKFAIERARLLIWGESVGISSTNATGCTKVESAHVRPLVEQILNCIRMLFDDTNALTTRYGLKPTSNNEPSSSLPLLGPSTSNGAIGLSCLLKTSYIRFKSRIEQNHNRTGTAKKTKWAIRDKQKFVSLVDDIHRLIDGLEALTDSIDVAMKRAVLVRGELSTIEDLEDLRLIEEASAGNNQQWCDAASAVLGASISGSSGQHRISDWMSAVSDAWRSTVAGYEGSEPSWDLPEPSLSPTVIGLTCPYQECSTIRFRNGSEHKHKMSVHRIMPYDGNMRTFSCAVTDCPKKDKIWVRLDNFRQHCLRIHPYEMGDELLINPPGPEGGNLRYLQLDLNSDTLTLAFTLTKIFHPENGNIGIEAIEAMAIAWDKVKPAVSEILGVCVNKALREPIGERRTAISPCLFGLCSETKRKKQMRCQLAGRLTA